MTAHEAHSVYPAALLSMTLLASGCSDEDPIAGSVSDAAADRGAEDRVAPDDVGPDSVVLDTNEGGAYAGDAARTPASSRKPIDRYPILNLP